MSEQPHPHSQPNQAPGQDMGAPSNAPTDRNVLRAPQDAPANYPKVPGIDEALFQLSDQRMPDDQRMRALEQLRQYETKQKEHFLGYQANQALDFTGDLKEYLDFHINNIGDPFVSGNFTVNSKWIERAVLDYYAKLWHAKTPHDPRDPESYWGYVLSMGSTEGNLYGLWSARDYLSGKLLLEEPEDKAVALARSQEGHPTRVPRNLVYQQALAVQANPNAYTPVAFYSEDTHYSIIKAMRVLDIRTFYEIGTERYPGECPIQVPGVKQGEWPKEVPSQGGGSGPGSIDVDALAALVEFFAAKGFPIIVCFNYGTTFKGAYDNVEEAGNRLLPILKKYGLDERKVEYSKGKYDTRTGYWFHVDAALGASYMPFIERAYDLGLTDVRGPNFDFRLPFVHSLVMSGHKWIGAPWPAGVYMTRVKMQLKPPDDPAYIGAPDTTFAGSRNGFSAMILWDYLTKNSYDSQMERALKTEDLAAYAHKQLLLLGEELKMDLWVERSPLSLTIRFKQANPDIVFKYSLSGESLYVNGQVRSYSHIFMMPSVTKELIDAFIQDLRQPGAFPDQNDGPPQTAERNVAPDARRLMHVPHIGRGFR